MAPSFSAVVIRGRWVKHTYPGSLPLPERETPPVNVEVADISTPERLADAGLRLPAPDRRSWLAFQRVGERLAKDGWAGLIAPSAARPAGKVLCLFRDEHGVSGAHPIPPPREIAEPPPPPTGLRT